MLNFSNEPDEEKINKMVSYLMNKDDKKFYSPDTEFLNNTKHNVKRNKTRKKIEKNKFGIIIEKNIDDVLIIYKSKEIYCDIFFNDNNKYASNIFLEENTINIVQLCETDRQHFHLNKIEYYDISELYNILINEFPNYEWKICNTKNKKVSAIFNKENLSNDILNIFKNINNRN